MMKLPAALVVLVVAGAVSESASATCPDVDDVADMSVDDVQGLLASWKLQKAFGTEFLDQDVDGFALNYLSPNSVSASAYPNAQPFHFDMLWDRLSACGIGKSSNPAQQAATDNSGNQAEAADGTKVATAPRPRRRAADTEQLGNGIRILHENSCITMGPDADVVLQRTESGELEISGSVRFTDEVTFDGGSSGAMSSGGGGDCDCAAIEELQEWREGVDEYFRKFFGIDEETGSDVWNNTDAQVVSNCNEASLDGYYWLDPGGVDAFMAHCSQDNDGNWWMKFAYWNGEYTPSTLAIGDFYGDVNNQTFKLSDAQINAVIGSDTTFGHTYRIHGHNEWSDLDYFVMTDEDYQDTAQGFGAPGDLGFYMHSEGALPSSNDWEVYLNDNLDSLGLSYIDNDGNRYFADHSSTINCYPLGTSDTRCFSSGSSADSHDQIDIVTLSLAVGELANVAAYPKLDGPVIQNCNEADEDGFYTLDTGLTDSFLAKCTSDDDGNMWMDIMYQDADYEPTFRAVNEAYMEHFGISYKLSDQQINAVLGTDDTFGHAYRIHGHEEWTELDYFLMTAQDFQDTARGYNIPMDETWYMHSEGYLPSSNAWEMYTNDNPDSLGLSYVDNDGDRYFCDHTYDINCYSLGTDDTRCWSSGSSADSHDTIDTFTMSVHVGTLKNVAEEVYPFPDVTAKGNVSNCNGAGEDGYYVITTPSADPFMAYCSTDNDGNKWMDIMSQVSDYEPTYAAVGEFYAEHFGLSYKLSDEQINAVLDTNTAFGHTYRIHSHDEWTELDYFLMTAEPFQDTSRGYNIPMDGTWYMHSEGYLPSSNAWELSQNDNPDSIGLSYIDNDGDRYFCDHSYTINCYSLGTDDTRCWSSGSAANSHDSIDYFTMSVHVGQLNNIAEDVYPFPELKSLGNVTTCNDADDDGYYLLHPGTVDPFMAYCSTDNDGNKWMEFMHQNEDYTPTASATGYFYSEHWNLPYKLSDGQINAVINTQPDTPHTYRVYSHDEWTELSYYLMTTNEFVDTVRGYNVPIDESWYWHSEGYLPSSNDWELYENDNPDSLGLSYIDNDGDRYFCDHSYDINCYSLGTDDTRCWSSGSSADSHDAIDDFTMSLHVGTLKNVDNYPTF